MRAAVRALLVAVAASLGSRAWAHEAELEGATFKAGLLPVNDGSQMFYWYCPPQTSNRTAAATAPTILWLQGGPGASGLIGALYEMGPYALAKKDNATTTTTRIHGLAGPGNSSVYTLVPREVGAWTQRYGLLFVDSPVGTGFSVVGSPEAYSRTETQVAANLWTFLQNFFAAYPELLDRGLYLMGESYGGHYVPAAASYILHQNDAIAPTPPPTLPPQPPSPAPTGTPTPAPTPGLPTPTLEPSPAPSPSPTSSSSSPSSFLRGGRRRGIGRVAEEEGPVRIPLRGMAIGDGLTDPARQVFAKARVAYDMGLLNGKEFLQARAYALRASVAALDQDYAEARAYRIQLEDFLASVSGVNLYDVRTFDGYDFDEAIADWAADPVNKARLNLPLNATWKTAEQYEAAAAGALDNDLMISYAPQVAEVLDRYQLPVLLYQGQFDLKDGPISNQAWIRALRWSGQQGYLNATRTKWFLDGGEPGQQQQAGWAQAYGRLTEVVVAGAGHLVPMDQPQRALDMVARWIDGRPFGAAAADATATAAGTGHGPATAAALAPETETAADDWVVATEA